MQKPDTSVLDAVAAAEGPPCCCDVLAAVWASAVCDNGPNAGSQTVKKSERPSDPPLSDAHDGTRQA